MSIAFIIQEKMLLNSLMTISQYLLKLGEEQFRVKDSKY